MFNKTSIKTTRLILVFIFFLHLLLPLPLPAGTPGGIQITEASDTRALGNLEIGDRVVDNSWEWEFRAGPDYTHLDDEPANTDTRPVVWIVVAKDHYNMGEGHVTLLSEELIARHTFDNWSTEKRDNQVSLKIKSVTNP